MKWLTQIRSALVPVLVFLLALAVQGAILWQNSRARAEQLQTEVNVTAQQAALRLETWLSDRLALGRILAANIEQRYASPEDYVADARAFLAAFDGIQAINWADANSVIRIVLPESGNEPALGKNLMEHSDRSVGEGIRKAIDTRKPARTAATIPLLQGGLGFATYFPAFDANGGLIGFINVVFRTSEVIDRSFQDPRFGSQFRVAIISKDGREVYSSTPEERSSQWRGAQHVEVQILDQPVTLTIAPVAARMDHYPWLMPTGVLGSTVVALVLALSVTMALRQSRKSREAERNLVQFASSVNEVFWLAAPDFSKLYYISPAYESLWGREFDERMYDDPERWFSTVVEEDREHLLNTYRQLQAQGFPRNDLPLHRIRRNDGTLRWIEARVYPIRDTDGSIIRVAGVDEDVTARVDADRERDSLVAAIEQTAESVAITDADGIVLYVNRAYEHVHDTPRHECLGQLARPIADADPEAIGAIWQTLDGGRPWTTVVESSEESGELRISEVTVSPVLGDGNKRTHLVVVGRDVSRELQLERQLLQSQRMEAVGLLAGGIAHDFNNLLQAMYGYVDLARLNVKNTKQVTTYLDEMREAIERARQHVQKILLYARRAEQRRSAWNVQEIVREAVGFLRPSTPSSIRFKLELDESCSPALISPSEIHQVIVNLCTNAFHAMPDGGQLRARVEQVSLTEATVADWQGVTAGDYACIIVEDTGSGIPENCLPRIFEPYFTTKGHGEGTGLGLSVAQGIISAHRGAIRVHSAVGVGTRFEILLPAADREAVDELAPAAPEQIEPRIAVAHVLLVDDDPPVLKVLKASLQAGGFTVEEFSDPLEALDRFKEVPQSFDVVVTDETMPNMRGCELGEQLRRMRADIPIILCSGLDDTGIEDRPEYIANWLTKPVRPIELIRAVNEVVQNFEHV